MSTIQRKGSHRPPLDRQTVLTAAAKLIERDGLDALTMRRLGNELGVQAMSLYHHVANKDAVLDGAIEIAAATMDLSGMRDGPWRERLKRGLSAYRQLGHTYPVLFALIGHRPVRTLLVLRPIDAALEVLADAGFAPGEALQAFRILNSYVYGYTLSEITGLAITSAAGAHPTLTEADQLPHLIAALPAARSLDAEAGFTRGLDILLAGLRPRE